MNTLIALVIMPVVITLLVGFWLALRPAQVLPSWAKRGVLANLVLFALGFFVFTLVGVQDVMAAEPVAAGDISIGMGLALIGIALPTGIAALAAAIALGSIGSAALAVVAEKPEAFGRTLIYMGLAEGVAIYGLVLSILMLGKV
jgi:V/A-type H+-transporting ATPase subunit K